MQSLGLKIPPILEEFGGKIELLNTHDLLCFAAVCRKIATSCPPTFLTHDAFASERWSGWSNLQLDMGNHSRANALGSVRSFSRFRCGLLADNQLQQHASDRVELGGVDERVGADVEKRAERGQAVGVSGQRQVETDVHQQKVDVVRDVGDDVERADEDHRFDYVHLNVIRTPFGGTWFMTLTVTLTAHVGSHHLILMTDDNQNAPVAEDEPEHLDAEE